MKKKTVSHGQDEYKAIINHKLKQQQLSQVPSEEAMASANAHMAAQNRIYKIVRNNVLWRFADQVPLHEIYLFPGTTTDYHAFVFYESVSDVQTYHDSEVEHAIKNAISEAFASNCKNAKRPTVAFNFDSHENVKNRCNGNYLHYLR